jgi:hypothetical protein
MQKNNFLIRLSHSAGFAGLIGLSSLVKFSWMVGSHISFFSGINIMAPLSGAFGGVFGSIASFALRTLIHFFLFGVLSVKCLTLGIPNFFASLYWGTTHWLIRVGLPLTCMMLFWAHPVGLAAGAYALYWLVPVAVHCLARKHVFFEALGSTFVAHAVGSVIWLYVMPMTSGVWLALIPVVAIERLLFATGMVIAHYGITFAARSVNRGYAYCAIHAGQVSLEYDATR